MTASLPASSPAAQRRGFLHRLNPLAKIVATIPAVIALVALRDVTRPAMLLVLAMLLILAGAHLDLRTRFLVLVGLPTLVGIMSLSFGVWIDPSYAADTRVLIDLGTYQLTTGMWLTGLATALRFTAILALSLIAGLTMTGPDLVRSMVQQARLSYRIAYAALAAIRFVPRLRTELDTIRAAHRVRGITASRGPVADFRRRLGYTVPLMAGSIRHAERVALAMDTRAFGAYPDRTERHQVPLRTRDTLFVLAFWTLTALILTAPPLLGNAR